jgi:acetyl esterase/lipase
VSGTALTDAMLSPLNAKFHGLKPFMVASGTDEILEDDSIILCRRLKEADVPATYVQFKGQGHSWSYYNADSEPAQRLFDSMAKFVQQQVGTVNSNP